MQCKFLLQGTAFAFLILSASACSCDPEGRKACTWVLEAEPGNQEKVQTGYVPVCARNRETMKQDCRLQIKLELAKLSEGKKFRYSDMKVASVAIPRTISEIKYCEE